MSLVPLLLAYSLARNRSWDHRLFLFVVPVVVVLAYDMFTYHVYGTGLLLDAASYATVAGEQRGWGWSTKLLTGLSFTGGCVAVAAFYAPVLWPKRWWGIAALVLLLSMAGVLAMGTVGNASVRDAQGIHWSLACNWLFLWLLGFMS